MSVPVTRPDDGAVVWMRCLTCGSHDVERREDHFIDEFAGPNERKQFRISIVVCEEGHEHKLYDAWDEALTRMPAFNPAAPPSIADQAEQRRLGNQRSEYRFSGRRAQVAAALLSGPLDAHDIADRTGMDHNQVGSRANELAKAGWVDKLGRHTGKKNAKTLMYALTAEGRDLALQWANAQDRNAA